MIKYKVSEPRSKSKLLKYTKYLSKAVNISIKDYFTVKSAGFVT